MYYQNIIGQSLLKKQLKTMLFKKIYPQSQLFIDPAGYGGLPLAVSAGLSLIHGLEKVRELEQKRVPFSTLIDHPDLHFVYPSISNSKTNLKSENVALGPSWKEFLITSPYGDIYDWLKLLDSGNKQGAINVEEVHKIHQKMNLKSHAGGNKVLILWGAEKLNSHAANKLLKILEEPPKNTYFLFVVENSFSLLPTLISRCQKIKLPPIDNKAISDALEKMGVNKNQAQIIKHGKGSWRKVLKNIFEKEEKIKFEKSLIEYLKICFQIKQSKKAIIDLFNWSDSISSMNREEQKTFVQYILEVTRQALFVSYRADQIVDFQPLAGLELKNLSPHVHSKNIQEITTLLEETIYFLERNANPKILFSYFSIALARELNIIEQPS